MMAAMFVTILGFGVRLAAWNTFFNGSHSSSAAAFAPVGFTSVISLLLLVI
jgi:hypothetical protein